MMGENWKIYKYIKLNTFLNNFVSKKKIIKISSNKNGSATYQNLWETAKIVQRGTFVDIKPTLRKKDLK